MSTDEPTPAEADPGHSPNIPHGARIWNYRVGGTDNFPADREVAEAAITAYPGIVAIAGESRRALVRVVRFLVEEAGIRQFLDIGTGLPTENNTHGVAQRIAPESRIVYVDKDPLVLIQARTLLTSTPEGATVYLEADVRKPEEILEKAAGTLDFDKLQASASESPAHLIWRCRHGDRPRGGTQVRRRRARTAASPPRRGSAWRASPPGPPGHGYAAARPPPARPGH
ncbi:SAM-dependent methyltransferase [Pseudofrankia asymbiotica]|uniref:SAM-dependent methyltransferase n=1 Tax=Pseudofrankia asymbiotica TaxID=1834516 RepID=UPI001F51C5A8|nr:SAM-dependent methyltransferase [Pseudofrankia asymbiotica]